jgi:hypothetical protein
VDHLHAAFLDTV